MMNQQTNFLRVHYSGQEQCSSGHAWGPAVRPHYLLHVILSGEGIFQYEQHTYRLKAGDAFLIRPLKSHFYQADETNPWQYVWVGFDGSITDELLNQTAFQDSPVYVAGSANACEEILKLAATFENSDRNSMELLALLLQVFAKMPAKLTTHASTHDEHYYQTAIEYIHQNYTYDVKIQDIANYVGIDRTYLYKIFMREGNLSPKQYLIQYRIRAAAKLLQTQKYTVTETAYSCGFHDSAAFCSHFRHQTGLTPRQYKERILDGTL